MGSTFDQKNTISSNNMSEEEACLYTMKLACGAVLPMVLKSAIDLDLLELIKKAGPNASVSASELASQLPTKNPDAASMIDRILRLLSAHSVLVCSVKAQPNGVERRYSLAPVCKFLTKNEDGVSISSFLLPNHGKVLMESWYHLKDAVLEGGTPFNKAYGMNVYEYLSVDLSFHNIFYRAMSDLSNIFGKQVVETYKGFEGLKSLVDVGGGIGSTISAIISKYPSIRGINFDLPHVIQEAPHYPGVEHISGDMFSGVPKGDAIYLQCVCHNWSDEHCQKLLKNCYEALPDTGKVIIADFVYPEEPNNELEYGSMVAVADLTMMAYTSGGKERTENEFKALARGAGFKKLIKVCRASHVWIIELHK